MDANWSAPPRTALIKPEGFTPLLCSWLPMKPKSGNVSKSEWQESLHPCYPDRSLPQSKGGDIVASFSPLLKGEIPGIELVCWSGSLLECVSGLRLLSPAGAVNRRGLQSLCPLFIRLWRSKQTKMFHPHVSCTLYLSITFFFLSAVGWMFELVW